jgi:hypothetical protein
MLHVCIYTFSIHYKENIKTVLPESIMISLSLHALAAERYNHENMNTIKGTQWKFFEIM